MVPVRVNVDNFVRAETHRMFHDIQSAAGGIGRFRHNRIPADITEQTVIRLNRDTLYSFAVVDLAHPARLVVPDAGGRYLSVMVIDENHFVTEIMHDPGTYTLSSERHGSRHVLVGVRILVDPNDIADIAVVSEIQDRIVLESDSSDDFVLPDYDVTTLDNTRDALLDLARGLTEMDRMFGSNTEVDPVRHLIGCAAGWGGLPSSEATYIGANPDVPAGEYQLRFENVPVDAFWSVSVYNAQGFFEPNEKGLYTVNSVTGVPDVDGAITVNLVQSASGELPPNAIVTPEGWNYLVRLYRPRAEILSGGWTPPSLVARVR